MFEGTAEGRPPPRSTALFQGNRHTAAGPQPHLLMPSRRCLHWAQNMLTNTPMKSRVLGTAGHIHRQQESTPFHAQAKLVAKQHDKWQQLSYRGRPASGNAHTPWLQGAWMTSQREGGPLLFVWTVSRPLLLWHGDRTSVARQVERRPCQQTHRTRYSLLQQPAMAVGTCHRTHPALTPACRPSLLRHQYWRRATRCVGTSCQQQYTHGPRQTRPASATVDMRLAHPGDTLHACSGAPRVKHVYCRSTQVYCVSPGHTHAPYSQSMPLWLTDTPNKPPYQARHSSGQLPLLCLLPLYSLGCCRGARRAGHVHAA